MFVIDFAFYLTLAVVITGLISLLDQLFWKKKRGAQKPNWLIEYSRSLFPVLIAIWAIRSFIAQPYRVPTGSLEPTILPGDFIVVNQFAYGLRLPVTNTQIIPVGLPKRGDITLFHSPVDPSTMLIKRLIGLPGDHVVYHDKHLWINGLEMQQTFVGKAIDYGNEPGQMRAVNEYQENLLGVKHDIFVQAEGGETQNVDVVVPPHSYFMMGDNRDNSADSRIWGFAPENHLVGKALVIWMSWDPINHSIRWSRLFSRIH